MDPDTYEFVEMLTSAQPALYACILSVLPDRTAVYDILQETNLTLWNKARDFQPGTSFMAWASRIARYHVLNYRRKLSRERLIFDDELFAELCERQSARAEDGLRYAELLRECLGKLPHDQHELLTERYMPGGSVSQIARLRGQTAGAVSQMLYRIREALLDCISRRSGDAVP